MSAGNAAKVLIVDDAAFMRVVLKDILVANGFSTIEAGDGGTAIEAYKKHKPDLVTMDINMPGVDGLQAVKAILQMNSMAKIVMVTAVEQKHVVQKAIKLGAKDYMTKPFDRNNVITVVKKVLNGGAG